MTKKVSDKKSQAFTAKHFWCIPCCDAGAFNPYFKTDKYETEDGSHYAICPNCKTLCVNVGHYYANLSKMWKHSTGPKTEAGKNRSRLNGFKTGRYSKKLYNLAPALFGKYSICDDCEKAKECEAKELKYCVANLDNMVRIMAAYENGDISDLKHLAGLSQGKLHLVLENMLHEMFDKGLMIEKTTKFGSESVANPLISQLNPIINLLGFSSDQQKMNPLQQKGNLDKDKGTLDMENAGEFVASFLNKMGALKTKTSKLKPPEKTDSEETTEEIPGENENQGPSLSPFKKKINE